MKTLAVTVYIAELTLDANRYRDAKMKAMKSVKLIEEKHRNDLQRHVTNVKQARNILDQVDVRFVSPSTGGIEKRCRDKDVTGLAVTRRGGGGASDEQLRTPQESGFGTRISG